MRSASLSGAASGTAMTEVTLDVAQIKKLLPHRPPMLFVERLTDIVKMESATGWKAVSINEPYFQGHFPRHPVLPGVLWLGFVLSALLYWIFYSISRDKQSEALVIPDEAPEVAAPQPG